jgi:hypothetical protein
MSDGDRLSPREEKVAYAAFDRGYTLVRNSRSGLYALEDPATGDRVVDGATLDDVEHFLEEPFR